jgi:hypothetical protein
MKNKQIQRAGDYSQQLQADNMIVITGINEKRAREIFREMSLQARKDYTQEALAIANSRVAEFENQLLPKMEALDGALEAFADPSFQILLVEAQKTAASTERPADYALLSELLIHRFQKGENRIVRAGISRAIGIVDVISDDALLGLTILHSASGFFPRVGDIHFGLDVLNSLFGKLFYNKLPTGNKWLDHLDILNAVRINSFISLIKIQELYTKKLVGYIDSGIEKESENHKKAIELLTTNQLPKDMLVQHALNKNFYRLNLQNRNEIESPTLNLSVLRNRNRINRSIVLTKEQKNAIKTIYELYTPDEAIKQENIKVFMQEWDKRPNLKILREWWDNINPSIRITSVGKAIAHANAQRCDKNLPPLDY